MCYSNKLTVTFDLLPAQVTLSLVNLCPLNLLNQLVVLIALHL